MYGFSLCVLYYTDPRALHGRPVFYDAPVILDGIICIGFEELLTECDNSDYGEFAECSIIAAIYCEGDSITIDCLRCKTWFCHVLIYIRK